MDVDDGTASQRKTGDANIRRLEDGGMHAFRFSIFGCRRRFPLSGNTRILESGQEEILEYCHWSVRRSAGVVVRSVLNISWDELKQTYLSKEFDVRMSLSVSNL